MKIQSINIAQTQELKTATETKKTGILKTPVAGPIQIQQLGLEGDFIANTRVHGGLDQAVYLYGSEDNAWWSEQLGYEIAPGTFGENLTVTDFDSRCFHIGDRLTIGDVVLEISGPRMPCANLAARMGDTGFVKTFFAAQRPGVYARVIHEGSVTVGQAVEWVESKQDYAKALDVFLQWNSKNKSEQVLKHILRSPVSSLVTDKLELWLEACRTKASPTPKAE